MSSGSAAANDGRPIAVLVDREGLGDVMLKAPFLRALRRAFPGRAVWWIATHQTSMEGEVRALFQQDVGRVIAHAGLGGKKSEMLPRLAALPPFARVFDARTKISTVALARRALQCDGFHCCLPGYVLCDGAPLAGRRRPRHIARRMLSLVECATGRPADGSGWVDASPEAKAAAGRDLPDGRTYVGVAPGSREAVKNWPMQRFVEVGRSLAARGLTPVFLLGPMEAAVGADIAAQVPSAVIRRADAAAAPGAAIDRLIADGQRFAALLANDNGVGHLVGGAGVPVVSLFGPTDPRRWAPVAPANRVLRAQDFGGVAMSAIPTSTVAEAVLSMVEAVGSDQPPPAMKS